jgi:hypothetical protein
MKGLKSRYFAGLLNVSPEYVLKELVVADTDMPDRDLWKTSRIVSDQISAERVLLYVLNANSYQDQTNIRA